MSIGPTTQPPQPTDAQRANLIRQALNIQVKRGANWFFLIAALSLVNTVITLVGGATRFVVGLGVTDIVAGVAREFGNSGMVVSIVVNVVAAGIFAGFGLLARTNKSWSFIVGMVLYTLDGLLFLLVPDIMSIAFHVLALVFMFKGLKANMDLMKLQVPVQA